MNLRIALAILVAGLVALALPARETRADEGWVINSFDVTYDIDASGIVTVVEDIRVDFGSLEKHGIFREMPVRYSYDDKHDREIPVGQVRVDDGSDPWPFELISSGANLQIKIGDPDKTVSGQQRYRISYVLTSALNPFPDHDEFFWNVTGNDWDVRIESASATVRVPRGIDEVACYEGLSGSTRSCRSTSRDNEATFEPIRALGTFEGLTIVVGLEKGAVEVSEPLLVPKEDVWSDIRKLDDPFSLNPIILAVAGIVLFGGVVATTRQWWLEGRDHWLGDRFYIYDDAAALGSRKPLLARETVVVEFQPPEVDKRGRRLRPAEIGVLLDEQADTLDVSATIVDLAVRKHLVITETKSGGFLGLFKKSDYELTKTNPDDSDLLPYESRLKTALFSTGDVVKMSGLRTKFHEKLDKVKDALYKQVTQDKLFARNPDSTRVYYRIAGGVIVLIGVLLAVAFGWLFEGALIGVAIAIVGALVFLLAHLMARRTARGRTLYRRSLGFRRFMTESDRERQRFAERANIFHEYLPYAIIYGCVDKWARAFEDLGIDPGQPDYYVGTRPFVAMAFADTIGGFSATVSSTMASTPGGSGSSGFGGGGSSGGGGGGGGGGSW